MSRELRTDEERRAIVREWDKSGLTAGEFAESLGIQANTLRIWGRAVRGPLKHWTRSRTRPVPRKVELVEVEGGLSGGAEPRIEISLSNGRRLTLFTSWTPKLIAEIVSALEGDE